MRDYKGTDQTGDFGSWPYPIAVAILAVVIYSAVKALITGSFLRYHNGFSLKAAASPSRPSGERLPLFQRTTEDRDSRLRANRAFRTRNGVSRLVWGESALPLARQRGAISRHYRR